MGTSSARDRGCRLRLVGQLQRDGGRVGQRARRSPNDGNEWDVEARSVVHQVGELRRLARIREHQQRVRLGDHAEIAVAGFRRVDEERRRPVEAKVAAILFAIWPLLPMPERTILPAWRRAVRSHRQSCRSMHRRAERARSIPGRPPGGRRQGRHARSRRARRLRRTVSLNPNFVQNMASMMRTAAPVNELCPTCGRSIGHNHTYCMPRVICRLINHGTCRCSPVMIWSASGV